MSIDRERLLRTCIEALGRHPHDVQLELWRGIEAGEVVVHGADYEGYSVITVGDYPLARVHRSRFCGSDDPTAN